MLSVPFGSAELNVPLRFEYDRIGFNISIAGEFIGTFKFCLSVAKDISAIETAIDTFLTGHPQYVRFYTEAVDGRNQIRIPDGDRIVWRHITEWCRHWHVDIREFTTLSKIVDKFGNATEPLAFTFDTQFFGQKTSSVTAGHYNIDYTDGRDIQFTSTATSNYQYNTSNRNFMLAPIFDLDAEIAMSFSVDTSHSINDPRTIPETTISLSIFRNKLIPLIALKCINNNLEYILGDILSMSKAKYSYFIMCLDEVFKLPNAELYHDLCAVHGMDIEELHKMAIQSMADTHPAMYRFFHDRADVIADIVNTIPKFIDDFPFESEQFAIPNISARPQTPLQWMMTNMLAQKDIGITDHLKKLELGFMKDVKDNTKKLLHAIHCPEKTLGMFLNYQRALDENGIFKDTVLRTQLQGNAHPLYEYGMREDELKNQCNKMLEFIADGERIFNEYPEPLEIEGFGTLKMAPIKGTYLKQMRNAIYNHRMENKVTLDYKLQQLRKNGDNDNQMKCMYDVPDILEDCRIKYKDEMILLGSTLKHCLGNYTSSSDLFFRRESVCAQVRMPELKLGQCYDRNNKTTIESKEFGEWIEMQLDLWYAREIHQEITNETGVLLENFEKRIDVVRAYVANKQRTIAIREFADVDGVEFIEDNGGQLRVENNDIAVNGNVRILPEAQLEIAPQHMVACDDNAVYRNA